MAKRILLLLALFLLLAIAAVSVAYALRDPTPNAIRLELTGTEGDDVHGKYVVDGKEHEFAGKLPADVEVRMARTFSWEVYRGEGQGQIGAATHVNGRRWGSTSAQGPGQGVAGKVELGSFFLEANSAGFWTVSKPARQAIKPKDE